ncbi:MAG: shikimate kinase [Nitriliruptoraceae bacterium]
MAAAGHDERVVLLGMMGAGKTRTGSALAARLGWAFHDSDEEVEARTGATGADIAAEQGVAALHELEARILLDALEAEGPMVVSAAASVIDDHRCRAAMASAALVVWLDAPMDVLARRVPSGPHRRTQTPQAASASLAARERRFATIADLRLDATAPTDELVVRIADELTPADPAT